MLDDNDGMLQTPNWPGVAPGNLNRKTTRSQLEMVSYLHSFRVPSGDSDTRMEFWKLNQSGDVTVAIDARSGKQWSYSALREDAARIQAALPRLGRKSLGLLIAQNCYECLAAYLAALNAGCALILLDATLNEALLRDFLVAYRPDWVFANQPELTFEGYRKQCLGRTRVA